MNLNDQCKEGESEQSHHDTDTLIAYFNFLEDTLSQDLSLTFQITEKKLPLCFLLTQTLILTVYYCFCSSSQTPSDTGKTSSVEVNIQQNQME